MSSGYPDFNIGEEVVLCLSIDDGDLYKPNEDYYVLTGMYQGKFALTQIEDSKKVYRNGNNDEFGYTSVKDEIQSIEQELLKNPIKKLTKEEIEEGNEKVFRK